MAKVHGKKAAIAAGGAIRIARAEIVVIGQDDGFMRRIVHPPFHCALRVVVTARTGINDLTAPSAGVASRDFPLPISRTIRTGVGKKIIGRLVVAVDPGRVLERVGVRQRPQASRGALGVYQGKHLGLEGAVMNQGTAGFRGGAGCSSRRIRPGWRGCS